MLNKELLLAQGAPVEVARFELTVARWSGRDDDGYGLGNNYMSSQMLGNVMPSAYKGETFVRFCGYLNAIRDWSLAILAYPWPQEDLGKRGYAKRLDTGVSVPIEITALPQLGLSCYALASQVSKGASAGQSFITSADEGKTITIEIGLS